MPRRLVKLAVSFGVWICDQTRKGFSRLVGLKRPGTCTVLYYHSVPKPTRPGFARQLDLLLRLARPMPATSEALLQPATLHAAITFDDAFSSFAESALPELIARRIPCTVFVPAGFMGKEPGWENPGNVRWAGEKVIDAAGLSAIAASGWVTIGAHGLKHRNLATLDKHELSAELKLPKEMLEKALGTRISALSFPYGSFGIRETKCASETGYKFLFSSEPSQVEGELRAGLIGRVSVEPTDWLLEFRLKLSGAYRWVICASRLKRQLRQFAGLLFS